MGFDYFHPGNVDQFTFYRVPKMLLGIKVPEEGKPLSHGAMLLYGMLLDRMGLSSMNSAKDDGKWVDEDGNVFIYYSQQSIMKDLKVSNKTASKLMKELKTCGLIETRLQGLGRPARLYLKNFASGSEDSTHESCNKFISRNEAKSHLKVKEVHTNNTDESDIERSDTDLIVSADGYDEMMQRTGYDCYFRERIEFDELLQEFPYNKAELEEILMLLVDTVCSNKDYIYISGDRKPASVVKGQLLKLETGHIRYVMNCFKNSQAEVRNIKQYMLATLYNAPITISHFYQAQVNHDMANEPIEDGREEVTWQIPG